MLMKNVLLVDDDSICNFLSTKLLQQAGIADEINVAVNCREALDLLSNHYSGTAKLPDVILLDLNMPVMDGFGFLEAFNRLNLPRKEDVSVVIVSSSQNADDMLRAKEMGITRYLTKPLSRESLLSALEV